MLLFNKQLRRSLGIRDRGLRDLIPISILGDAAPPPPFKLSAMEGDRVSFIGMKRCENPTVLFDIQSLMVVAYIIDILC